MGQVFQNLKIRKKLAFLIVVTLSVGLFTLGIVLFFVEFQGEKETARHHLNTLSKLISYNSRAALLFRDIPALENTLAALSTELEVVTACVYTLQGQIIADYHQKSNGEFLQCPPKVPPTGIFLKGRYATITTPILLDQDMIGSLFLQSELKKMYETISLMIKSLLFAACLAGFLSFLASLRVQRIISDPILSLAHTAALISTKKDYSLRVEETGKDELGTLSMAFNQMLNQIEDLLLDLRNSVSARDEFISIASHELKTPLTPIRANIQLLMSLLRSGRLSVLSVDKLDKILHITEHQLDRLTTLVNNLLDVSRITSGRMTLDLCDIDLNSIVHEIASQMKADLQASGCALILELEPNGVPGNWDGIKIGQVLSNLLSNAARYAPGKPVRVVTRAREGMASLFVEDSGPGIRQEDRDRIFQRFERVNLQDSAGGLGLGLFITRQMVESHGGKIWVESTMGHGSTFIVELPARASSEVRSKAA